MFPGEEKLISEWKFHSQGLVYTPWH